MTRTTLLSASLALACLVGQGQTARAQYPYGGSPYSRPAVSPYLNLLRGGAPPALNYSTLVRPDIDYRAGINRLAGQTAANEQAITGLQQGGGQAGPLVTGAAVGFQNHGSYFGNLSGGAAGGFGFGQGAGGLAGGRGGAAGGGAFGGGAGGTPARGGRGGR